MGLAVGRDVENVNGWQRVDSVALALGLSDGGGTIIVGTSSTRTCLGGDTQKVQMNAQRRTLSSSTSTVGLPHTISSSSSQVKRDRTWTGTWVPRPRRTAAVSAEHSLVRARSTMARYLGAAGMCSATASTGQLKQEQETAVWHSLLQPLLLHNTSKGKHMGCAATARTKI